MARTFKDNIKREKINIQDRKYIHKKKRLEERQLLNQIELNEEGEYGTIENG